MFELDDTERKILKRLRDQHNNWKSIRLMISIFSAICIVISMFLEQETILLLTIGAFGLSYSLGSWHGRPEISLLLKYVEANIKKEET